MRQKSKLHIFVTSLFILISAAGCGESKTYISASDYDQTCERDNECIRVIEGNVCECGHPAAINIDARDEFREDKRRMSRNCNEGCSEEFPPMRGMCVDGTCELRNRDAAGQPDTSSDTVSGDAQ